MRILFLEGAVLLAITGQFLLARQVYIPAVALFAAALLCWWLTRRDLNESEKDAPRAASESGGLPQPPEAKSIRGRMVFLAVPLGLSVLTFATATHNTFTLLNVSLWLLSIITLLVLFAKGPQRPRLDHWPLILGALGLLLLLGGFFYYYHLDQLPGEMTSDHAEKILDINDVLNGARPIFFTRNTGREPLEFYLVAGLVTVTGHRLDFMALKWVTATAGLLVVPLTLFLGAALFDSLVGALAAAFVAINLWGIGIARMGLRFPFTPFFAALTFLFLFRALKNRRRNDFLLAGLSLGAGLYGYHAFKIAPLVVVACLALGLWVLRRSGANRAELGRYVVNVVLLVSIALVVFMPLLRYMVDHPESFWRRVETRISNAERPLPGNPVLIFADNIKNALFMFNVQGDHSWPNTLSEVPVLDEVSGGLFVLGASYALYRWLRRGEAAYGYVVVALVGFLLPSALAIAFPIENPSVVRAGGAVPFVMILVALPLARLARGFWETAEWRRPVLAAAAVVPFILVGAQLNYQRYFVRFDEQYRANSWNSSEIAATILDFARNGGSLDHAWVMAYPYWVDTRNVAINLGQIDWNNVLWHAADMPDPSRDPSPRLYILNTSDVENLQGLEHIYPQGIARVLPSRTKGKEYIGFYVPVNASFKKVGP